MKKSELTDIKKMNSVLERLLQNTMNHKERVKEFIKAFDKLPTDVLAVYRDYYLKNGSKLVSDIFKESILSEEMLNLKHSEKTLKDIIKAIETIDENRTKQKNLELSDYINKDKDKDNER